MKKCPLCKGNYGERKITVIYSSDGFSRNKKIIVCKKCFNNILKTKSEGTLDII